MNNTTKSGGAFERIERLPAAKCCVPHAGEQISIPWPCNAHQVSYFGRKFRFKHALCSYVELHLSDIGNSWRQSFESAIVIQTVRRAKNLMQQTLAGE